MRFAADASFAARPPAEAIVVTGKALPDAPTERVQHVDLLSAHDLSDSASLMELKTAAPSSGARREPY
jgi:hypothetical protein